MGTKLTDQEIDVLRATCGCSCSKQVAAARGVSQSTVKNQLTSVYRKLERVGAIPVRGHKKTVACVWLWTVTQAARGEMP